MGYTTSVKKQNKKMTVAISSWGKDKSSLSVNDIFWWFGIYLVKTWTKFQLDILSQIMNSTRHHRIR